MIIKPNTECTALMCLHQQVEVKRCLSSAMRWQFEHFVETLDAMVTDVRYKAYMDEGSPEGDHSASIIIDSLTGIIESIQIKK